MAIQEFDPTTYHPKKTGSKEPVDNGAVSKSPAAPKGLPGAVSKKNPKDGMVTRKVYPPTPASTPSGSGPGCPADVQHFDPRPRGTRSKSGY